MSISKWSFAPRAVALALVFVVFGAANALAQTFAYVTNQGGNTVSVINTGTSTVTATVPAGPVPIPVAATPDGAFVWVGNLGNDTISVIDTATNTVVQVLPGPPFSFGIAFTPDGAFAYVTSAGTGEVTVIDTATFATATNTVTGSVPVGDNPQHIAFARTTPPPPPPPTNKDQCKNGGWQTFTNPSFQNQGACIKYVNQH
jgi:YVTN family beta-propeller protein